MLSSDSLKAAVSYQLSAVSSDKKAEGSNQLITGN
jgi:hypothetical protein